MKKNQIKKKLLLNQLQNNQKKLKWKPSTYCTLNAHNLLFSSRKRPKKYVPEVKVLTVEEMEALKKKEKISSIVNLIQVAERGRQARLYFNEKYNENAHKKKSMRKSRKNRPFKFKSCGEDTAHANLSRERKKKDGF